MRQFKETVICVFILYLQNWLAFETLERPFFAEHGSTNFARSTQNPLSSSNYAQCQVKFMIFHKNVRIYMRRLDEAFLDNSAKRFFLIALFYSDKDEFESFAP